MTDALEADILAAVKALRRRADLLRKKAAPGVSALDGYRRATIGVTSESAVTLRIATSLDAIAADLEAGCPPTAREVP
jgi:hypothetical protein